MTGFFKNTVLIAATLVLVHGFAGAAAVAPDEVVLTHADAAVILAKYSGQFDRYVAEDAGLSECVAFLNKAGVYFGLMEVVNHSEFAAADCARVMGQIALLKSGEAEYASGKIKLPNNMESWVDFCIINDISYINGHSAMFEMLRIEKERKR